MAGEFSLDFRGNEVDLLAALVRDDRIVSGPCIRTQDNPILRRQSWLSAHPFPLAAPLSPQSQPPAHPENKARDGGPGLARMRDPVPWEDTFQGCISGNGGDMPGFAFSVSPVTSPDSVRVSLNAKGKPWNPSLPTHAPSPLVHTRIKGPGAPPLLEAHTAGTGS